MQVYKMNFILLFLNSSSSADETSIDCCVGVIGSNMTISFISIKKLLNNLKHRKKDCKLTFKTCRGFSQTFNFYFTVPLKETATITTLCFHFSSSSSL
eukprot:gene4524-3311_t